MRNRFILSSILLCSVGPAIGHVDVGIGFSNVSIGINVPMYPELVPVPGYPVYYAPGLRSNYFYYDGMYWVYQSDNWYASSWYNGPWGLVDPEDVPVYILRVPVSFYPQPPGFFVGWQPDAPPRWGEHWGGEWEQRRAGWERWDRKSVPPPAPLPVYQRQYSGDRYPRAEQQRALRGQIDHYQPRDPAVRKQYATEQGQSAPASTERGTQLQPRAANPRPQDTQRSPASVQQSAAVAPRATAPQKAGENPPRSALTQAPPRTDSLPAQRPQQPAGPREQAAPASRSQETGAQGRGATQDSKPAREADRHPQQAAAHPQQSAVASHAQETGPPGKAPAPQEARRQDLGQEKGHEKTDDHGQEHK